MDLPENKPDQVKVFKPESFRADRFQPAYERQKVAKQWKNRNFLSSFEFAWSGIIAVFYDERNMKKHALAGLLVIGAGLVFQVAPIEWLFLLSSIALVMALEIVNSAIENVVDLVCGETYSIFAKNAKDMAAGAVLLMSFYAVIVGLVIFVPKLIALLV